MARQAEMVRNGEVSPTELVGSTLERIDRLDPELNAFRKVFADKAMLEAEQAEARRNAGDKRPLLGVPVAIKDEIDVTGEINLHGTDAFEVPAKADAEEVRRLREAGAIIVGLTLLPELAICGFTESATYGVTRNPWNRQRTPGGSSGGSAAAAAPGRVPIASAGDGAGSIRIPAACCGLFGLKPTRGRVSLAPKLEGWRGMVVEGCVSRSVLDSALWLDIVSGGSTEAEAPAPPAQPLVESVKDSPDKLRVAWSTAAPRAILPATVTDEVKQATEDAAALLAGLGHDVKQPDPDWGNVGNTLTARFLKGVAETVEEVPLPERLERRTRGFGKLGGLLPQAPHARGVGDPPPEVPPG